MNDDFGYYTPEEWEEEVEKNSWQYCYHEWVPVELIFSTVYNCRKCGAKREEVEK